MPRRPQPDAPPPWTNGPLTFFHGTLLGRWKEIVRDGVSVHRGRAGTDFGPGFYTTADRAQAAQCAEDLADRIGDAAVVAWAELDRDLLASLECLYFVRGHESAVDFWSLVYHCRKGALTHRRAGTSKAMYDVVVGPVSRNYRRRAAYENMDQISFHTPEAQAVLNRVAWNSYDPTR